MGQAGRTGVAVCCGVCGSMWMGAWLAEDGGSGRATSLMWCSWDGAGNNNFQVVR